MKSLLFTTPVAFIISLLIVKLGVSTIHVPVAQVYLLAGVLICTLLLFNRSLIQLGVIGALTAYAQLNAEGAVTMSINGDMLLALILALIVLPAAVRLMGMDVDLSRAG